jgi:hypothetical protein
MGITVFRRGDSRTRAPKTERLHSRRFLQDRRRFLATGFAVAGAYVVAHQGTTWIVGAGRAWAAELQAFDTDLAETVLHASRAFYPHDFLSDAHYAKVVQDLDAEAAGTENTAKLAALRDGMLALDQAAGGSFAKADPEQREAALATLAGTPFFDSVRGKTLVSLYSQPEVWEHFGYEGPSYEKGGYLFNGFDDLSWLPAPPPEASPPVQH